MIFQGIRVSIAKKPYGFVILAEVLTPCPPPHPLDQLMDLPEPLLLDNAIISAGSYD